MADYTITNVGDAVGTAGVDRLTYIYNTDTNDVWLTDLTGSLATGYSGMFNGLGGNNGTFSGIENFTFIDLSGGNDIIRTGDGDDSLDGGAGNDELTGNGGIDTINGGAGNDIWGGNLATASEAIAINLNGTSTFLTTGAVTGVEAMTLNTGSGNDTIVTHRTSGMADTIDTGAGNDRITCFMGGTDGVAGGLGSDSLVVFYEITTNDVYLTNLAADPNGGYTGKFDGLGGNDIYFSGIEQFQFTDRVGGNDIINTGSGNDVLNGGAGDDVLNGSQGRDKINGGAGQDRWGGDLSFTKQAITINLNTDSKFLTTGLVRGIEAIDLTTGSGNDSVTGHKNSAMSDTVNTGAGDDQIRLFMGGTDSVSGGTGSDTLILSYGITTNDVYLTNLTADIGGGYSGTFNGLGGNDVFFSGIERFSFTDLSGGNDILRTGKGADILNGGAGNDELSGSGGADTLSGGKGLDTIIGGTGSDALAGGSGSDAFVYDQSVNEGRDTISDFQDGSDRIVIAGGSFAELSIRVVDINDLQVSLASGTSITLIDIAPSQITAADFLFS